MADIEVRESGVVLQVEQPTAVEFKKKYRDMGDGTYAPVVALAVDPTIEIGDVGIVEGGAVGEVAANPTANTILGRLKALLTGIALAAGSAIIGKVGIDQTTPGTTNLVSAGILDGANVTLGAKADAKNTATDTTAITAMSVWKQISASIQAAAASLTGTLSVAFGASATGGYSFLRIAPGQATTVVKASAGTLHTITLNSAATATNVTTIYDNATGVGTVIALPNVVAATVPSTLIFDLAFANGLTIITANANGGDMTVIYK